MRYLWSILIIGVALAGCESTPSPSLPAKSPVFFPAPPVQPRLQYLTSFSGVEDVGPVQTSALETFLLGEAVVTDNIDRPYGLAFYDKKIYVCDISRKLIEVINLQNKSFGYLTKDRRLLSPFNIAIDSEGIKYVADPRAGAIFVFDRTDQLQAILGKDQEISPIDVAVQGENLFLTDGNSNQVLVLDKQNGQLLRRIGQAARSGRAVRANEFRLISDLALDQNGNVLVTDRGKGMITRFDANGTLLGTISRPGDRPGDLVRPKGIAVDRENRIWAIDAGPSEAGKVYDESGQILLIFGMAGNTPGRMNLPADIIIDYDHVELFRPYFAEGAEIEFLVIVSNQFGPYKVAVYGFGNFPERFWKEDGDLSPTL